MEFQRTWVLVGCVLLPACVVTPRSGGQAHYSFDNSVDAACRQNPKGCADLAIDGAAHQPGIVAATVGGTVDRTIRVLDEVTHSSIEEALKECADDARSTVLLRYQGRFKATSPSAEECLEQVKDATGRRVTWAMFLGTEMHKVALECAEERLNQLRPGGFSLEPRYRFDPDTGAKRVVSPEEERALEQSGNSGELKGTLKPDVVLHGGNPLDVEDIYDFKFPCLNIDERPRWNRYPDGHPYQSFNQGEMYEMALERPPARVVPRQGVLR
jgi:hypothetical protein